MSSWEPEGARLSSCTLQLLDSCQGQEKSEPIGAMWAISFGKLPVQQITDVILKGLMA